MSIADIRRDYPGPPLLESEAGDNPIALFARWLDSVREREPDATAMAVATASSDGRTGLRTLLLKGFDDEGFVFFTNYESRKARDLAENNRASLLFFWSSIERQVRIDGVVAKVSDAESDEYFQSRPLESRISVYASRQSALIASRQELDDRFEAAATRFAGGEVPRPAWWGGYRLVPDEMEFWQGRLRRMHDRLRYVRLANGSWRHDRLAP